METQTTPHHLVVSTKLPPLLFSYLDQSNFSLLYFSAICYDLLFCTLAFLLCVYYKYILYPVPAMPCLLVTGHCLSGTMFFVCILLVLTVVMPIGLRNWEECLSCFYLMHRVGSIAVRQLAGLGSGILKIWWWFSPFVAFQIVQTLLSASSTQYCTTKC